ncbi:hypothetical protein AMAG_15813 [Allomyces macrogynus ATCC 38327]|uniref:mRNA cap guanine-N(7) methyltransferase n=1 Tax=Allomyces macrogynus (strain ATCC 38327) TaxID=578462 RepID=A0A0L0T8S1_ALLM3|nr:hypothetical protein AMAG_15813 [Allomyces macrogynus ATCC 38327]|eukprot:KNE71147.1 hypothetical protein AMAG_15813 [Allomyces macrogynus ATCC 38327]
MDQDRPHSRDYDQERDRREDRDREHDRHHDLRDHEARDSRNFGDDRDARHARDAHDFRERERDPSSYARRTHDDTRNRDRPYGPPPPAAADDRARAVALHYNARPQATVVTRQDSPIYQLRCFNNWVKAVLFQTYLRRNDRVLDMGCGKGGDLQKYRQADIRELYAFDVADKSIDQATERYQTMRNARFRAQFRAVDCYNTSIEPHLPRDQGFDVVSMQFCMHYAFSSEQQVRQMLANVTARLRPGGFFIGTCPNANTIVRKLRHADGLEFGNSIYTVKFTQKDECPVYGHEYSFRLVDAVDDCPEYLVHWPSFVKLAREYRLDPIAHQGFHLFYTQHIDRHRDLFVRMKVVTPDSPTLPADQWEAAGLYSIFAFQKTD